MAFCLNCGRRLADDADQCEGCGAPVRSGEASTDASDPADPGLTDEVIQLIRSGQKIAAIKAYRVATGCSLKAAKDAVENWMRAEGIVRARGGGCATSLFVLMVCVAGFVCWR